MEFKAWTSESYYINNEISRILTAHLPLSESHVNIYIIAPVDNMMAVSLTPSGLLICRTAALAACTLPSQTSLSSDDFCNISSYHTVAVFIHPVACSCSGI